jgi:ABC-type microcin C transport system duplicated ATPase subunit YejF
LRETLRVHPGVGGDEQARMHEVRLDATPDMLRRYPHQLSGGQQQRVSLAMAFACRPSLIVLDQPTTGLDVTTQRHVLDTIRRLCRGYRVAAVYVSHDLAVVSELVAEVPSCTSAESWRQARPRRCSASRCTHTLAGFSLPCRPRSMPDGSLEYPASSHRPGTAAPAAPSPRGAI